MTRPACPSLAPTTFSRTPTLPAAAASALALVPRRLFLLRGLRGRKRHGCATYLGCRMGTASRGFHVPFSYLCRTLSLASVVPCPALSAYCTLPCYVSLLCPYAGSLCPHIMPACYARLLYPGSQCPLVMPACYARVLYPGSQSLLVMPAPYTLAFYARSLYPGVLCPLS